MGQQERERALKRCCPPPVAKFQRASFFFLFWRRSSGLRLRGRGMHEASDDFRGGGFADLAVAVVDAALRKSVFAAAGTSFGVEFVERDDFLFWRELGKIDAGKFTGALGVLQKNLAGVVEGLHFDVADGQAEERTDFSFVKKRVAEAFVLLNDAAFRVEHERSGKRGDAAVLEADVIAGNGDGVVDSESFSKFLDGVLIFIVDDQSENLEALFVFVLEIDEVGNFGAAGSAPSGPEIQKDDFASGAREGDGLAVEAGELEVRREIGVADEADRGLLLVLGGSE